LANMLSEQRIGFVFLSANSDEVILKQASATKPYGFLVKPFREKDVLVMLDVAWYLHQHQLEAMQLGEQLSFSHSEKTNEFPEIIGKSESLRKVLEHIKIVARSETSVLIQGESGTGKELIAMAIHRLSLRKNNSLIIVNCAALPASLIESELFGHEKGAFTDAFEKRTGKFEQADGGTIFLDEIGELPLELQVKFLRVLQEKEVEPIGGKRKKINVRVIAATNRNLEEEMAAGRFRMDLYYRLNVFPIFIPPLRARRDDILQVAQHFLSHYATKEKKIIQGFSDEATRAILAYSWPGNVRELENYMERAVLLTTGKVVSNLNLPTVKVKTLLPYDQDQVKSMDENERDHIVMVLDRCNWKIYGEGGAAELLQINGSTLSSRMKKLGIIKKNILK